MHRALSTLYQSKLGHHTIVAFVLAVLTNTTHHFGILSTARAVWTISSQSVVSKSFVFRSDNLHQDILIIRVVWFHLPSVDARVVIGYLESMEQFDEWGKEEGKTRDVLQHTLSFLGVVTLVQKKQVCKAWQALCTQAIDIKCTEQMKIQSTEELRTVVRRYCKGKPEDMEDIARTYRFPIGKFDVSELEDFSFTFAHQPTFNEDINSWDVSKAKTMTGMFSGASKFNKPLDQWDTSQVTTMRCMFEEASSFNQPLDSWNTSRVKSMIYMFLAAHSFNQALDNWDTHEVEYTAFMFYGATAFNQPLDCWILSNVKEMSWMFEGAASFNQSLHNCLSAMCVIWRVCF